MPKQTIFAVGTGPLLEPGAQVFSGQCLRSWHFAAPLLAAGHTVLLYTIPIPGATIEDGIVASPQEHKGLTYQRCHVNDEARLSAFLEQEIERFQPTVLLGINTYPAYLLAKMWRPEPFWADLNGWTIAEGQVRSGAIGHDRDFGHFWRHEVQTLLTADRISAVSDKQAWAIYGELAMIGRFDHRTVAEEFTCTVPNAVHPDFATLRRSMEHPPVLEGKVPADGLVCLWSGGFNSWTDVDVLTAGLAEAMNRERHLHFVATGGPVIGHDEVTYKRFMQFAEKRFPKGRWHMLGWVDYRTMLDLHSSANCGLNLDAPVIETKFGARNRVTNMLGAGLPVLTTRGTEIADWIERNRFGTTIPPGDAAELGMALIQSVRESTAWRLRAARARARALAEFSPQATVQPLLDWLEAPKHAADRLMRFPDEERFSSTAKMRAWVNRKLKEPLPFIAPEPSAELEEQRRSASSTHIRRQPLDETTPLAAENTESGIWDLLKGIRSKR